MTPLGRALGYAIAGFLLLTIMGIAGWIEGGLR